MEKKSQFETVLRGKKITVSVITNPVLRPAKPTKGEYYLKGDKLVKA